MKVSCSSSDLVAHLQTVARVASTRSAVQALSGVQLAAQEGGVELRATDMEVGLRVPLEAEVARTGSAVLPGRLTLDVVRALPAAQVTVELRPTEGDVEITSGSATFHIRTLRSEDFPPLPEPGGNAIVEVPGPAFVETVSRVARSASRDETRPILTGILVSASGTELRMVATDSYRLSVKETPLGLAFREGEVTVSAQTPDVGEASETLPVAFAGEPFEIGFNPEFLRDGLESVESGDLVLKLISPLRPGLIESADGSGFLYLIMPIRLNV